MTILGIEFVNGTVLSGARRSNQRLNFSNTLKILCDGKPSGRRTCTAKK